MNLEGKTVDVLQHQCKTDKRQEKSVKGNFFYLLANALNKVVAMRLCTPLQTVTTSGSLKKNTLL